MSLVHIANMCSHIQNCSRARLSLTSVPSTNLLLALSLALHKSGFLSTVIRSGPNPPPILSATDLPHATHPSLLDPTHPDTAVVTRSNVASRRLWLGLKYWKDDPVLSEMKMESRPKKRVHVTFRELERIVRGREARWVKGLTRVGECMFLSTDQGVMEAREAAERQLGGLVLCRAV